MGVVNVAVLQMTSGSDLSANMRTLDLMVREAAAHGARVVATPENTDFLGMTASDKLLAAYDEKTHPLLQRCSDLAQELKVWISLGSIAIKNSTGKISNRSYLFSSNGDVVATYDKIHLFDVHLPSGEIRLESEIVEAGSVMSVADTDFGCVGLSICYDVRFPHLYRCMAQQGAGLFFIPAAFTVSTGQVHWEILLRARAIENGAFVVAAAQCGDHGGGRHTYGHSMIIDPWGNVLAKGGDVPDVFYAECDFDRVIAFREAIPSLHHDRAFSKM